MVLLVAGRKALPAHNLPLGSAAPFQLQGLLPSRALRLSRHPTEYAVAPYSLVVAKAERGWSSMVGCTDFSHEALPPQCQLPWNPDWPGLPVLTGTSGWQG